MLALEVDARKAGEACIALHDEKVRNVKSRRLQCDEIWSFNYCKRITLSTAKAAPQKAAAKKAAAKTASAKKAAPKKPAPSSVAPVAAKPVWSPPPGPPDPTVDLAHAVAALALDKKAEDVLILKVTDLTSYADCFILASAPSERQVAIR